MSGEDRLGPQLGSWQALACYLSVATWLPQSLVVGAQGENSTALGRIFASSSNSLCPFAVDSLRGGEWREECFLLLPSK